MPKAAVSSAASVTASICACDNNPLSVDTYTVMLPGDGLFSSVFTTVIPSTAKTADLIASSFAFFNPLRNIGTLFLNCSSVSAVAPSTNAEGTLNLVGALKQAMATTGYSDLKELQRIEVVVNSVKS
jgi:hypothetical protein